MFARLVASEVTLAGTASTVEFKGRWGQLKFMHYLCKRTGSIVWGKNSPVPSRKCGEQLLAKGRSIDGCGYSGELSEPYIIQSLGKAGEVGRILSLGEGRRDKRYETQESQLHFGYYFLV